MDIRSYLKSGPVDVEYVSHTGPHTKQGKKGPYQSYTYVFRLRSTGETFEQFLFDSDHRKIGYVGPNALVRLTPNEKGYPMYTVLPTGEAAMNIPQPKNTAQVATERAITHAVQEQENKQLRIDTSKIVFGYMNTAMAQGKTPKEAKAMAIDAWKNQEEAIEEILVIHYKGGQEQKFAPDTAAPLHTPSVKADDLPF